MKKIVLITMMLVFSLISTLSYARSMENERNMCLTRNALARSQCKDPSEFSFVGVQQGNIYVYNGFYGAKYTDFFCKIENGVISILSRHRKFRRSVNYYIDENECGVIDYYPAECDDHRQIRCCFPRSEKEIKRDKEAEFWKRTIPELLKEDQENAMKELKNKTAKSSETRQEEQSKE